VPGRVKLTAGSLPEYWFALVGYVWAANERVGRVAAMRQCAHVLRRFRMHQGSESSVNDVLRRRRCHNANALIAGRCSPASMTFSCKLPDALRVHLQMEWTWTGAPAITPRNNGAIFARRGVDGFQTSQSASHVDV